MPRPIRVDERVASSGTIAGYEYALVLNDSRGEFEVRDPFKLNPDGEVTLDICRVHDAIDNRKCGRTPRPVY